MSNFEFDGGSASKLPFEGGAELPGCVDEDSGSFFGHPVALAALVDKGVLWDPVGESLHQIELIFHGVAVVGVRWAELDAHTEALLVGHSEADLYAELVGPMALPLVLPFLGEDRVLEGKVHLWRL